MFSGHWRKFAAAGVAALAVAIAGTFYFSSAPFAEEGTEASRAIGCRHDEKHQSAEKARSDYTIAQGVDGAAPATEEYRRAAEAAANADKNAEECETAAQERSDLAAQWANAHVARDLRTWTIIEMLLLGATIGVGAASIWQNQKTFKANFDFAKEQAANSQSVSENQTRAFVYATTAELQITRALPANALASRGPPRLPSVVFVGITNIGPTPAINVSGTAKIWAEAVGEKKAVTLDFDQDATIDALVKGDPRSFRFTVPEGQFEPGQTFGNAFKQAEKDSVRESVINAFNEVFRGESKFVHCRGVVSYRDIFGDRFESEFHFRYFGEAKAEEKVNMLRVDGGLKLFTLVEKRPYLVIEAKSAVTEQPKD